MNELIAMHGWGVDSRIWSYWEKEFKKKGWIWKNGERGYWNQPTHNPQWTKLFKQKSSIKRVFLGHSLGPHLIDKEVLEQATDIIFLGSFSSFITTEKNSRIIKTALLKMQKSIGTIHEKQMLQSFLLKVNQPNQETNAIKMPLQESITNEGRLKLQQDLEFLSRTEELPKGLQHKAKVLVIEGLQDQIVSLEARVKFIKDLSKLLKEPPTHWELHNQGHNLIIPDLIDRITTWLET